MCPVKADHQITSKLPIFMKRLLHVTAYGLCISSSQLLLFAENAGAEASQPSTSLPTKAIQNQQISTPTLGDLTLWGLLLLLVILAIGTTIGKRKAKKVSIQNLELNRAMLQISLNGIYTTDDQNNLIEVNETYCRMSGYSRQELLQMNVADLEAMETEEQIKKHMDRVRHMAIETFQSKHRRKDGSLFDVQVSLKYFPEGGKGKTIVFVEDISQRKRAEEQLLRKQQLLEKAQELAILGSWETDIKSKESTCSDQAFKIYELPVNNPVPFSQFINQIHPEDRAYFRSIPLFEQPVEIEHRLLIDNKVKWIRVNSALAYDDDGVPQKVLAVAQDITYQKKLLDDYRRSAQLAALGTIAAGVAHEINNPIQGILNYASLIQEKPNNVKRTALLAERIANESIRIGQITNELLHYSRDNRVEFRPCDIVETIEGALVLMRRKIHQRGIKLIFEHPKDLPELDLQSQSIQQVIINLLDNSADALLEKEALETEKQIRINLLKAVRSGENCVCLQVYDNGSGMSDEVLDKAQEAFFTTKGMGKGTGLGLSIVNDIVRKHRGTLEIDSVQNQYTAINILLPINSRREST